MQRSYGMDSAIMGSRSSALVVSKHSVPLGCSAAGHGDELAQIAPALQAVRQHHHRKATRNSKVVHLKHSAQQKLEAQCAGLLHQFLRLEGATLKAAIDQAIQLGVRWGGESVVMNFTVYKNGVSL